MKVCEIDGCSKGQKSRGLCPMHLNRLYRHGDPLTVVKPQGPRDRACDVDGCDRDGQRRRLCWGHYTRLRRFGDVLADVPLDPDGRALREMTGTRDPEPDVETCVDCDAPAEGGMVKCWPCASADLARRRARKPVGDSKARPSEGRTGVRQVRSFGYAGHKGAA